MPSLPVAFRRHPLLLGAISLLMAAVFALGVDWTPTEQLFKQAQTQLRRGKYLEAESLALRLTRRSARYREGWLLAAEAAARLRRFEDARSRLENIPEDASPLCAARWMAAGLLEMQGFRRLSAAERAIRNVLKIDAHNPDAHQHLAKILSLEGRHWEALPHRLELVKNRQGDLTTLVLLALGDTANDNPGEFDEFALAAPDDAGVLCGEARRKLLANADAEARRLLEVLERQQPDWLTPRCWLGARLLAENDQVAFTAWLESLPAEPARRHPEVWFLRGRSALMEDRRELAGRCFAQVIQLDPNHLAANYQLGQLLVSSGNAESGQSFLDRSKLVSEYLGAAKSYVITQQIDGLPRAARLAEQLGLTAEAIAWHELLASVFRSQPQASGLATFHFRKAERLRKVRPTSAGDGRTSAEVLAALMVKVPSEWRAPPEELFSASAAIARRSIGREEFRAHFVDRAAEFGLKFSYFNGSRKESKSEFMYEFSGGGVAALDYDLDGWVDVYMTQGCEWPVDEAQRTHLDALFRNIDGVAFQSVASLAGVVEPGFSQGVTVGDYDNDGFPDLYVANIGPNRLFRNNGDGTFSDVTAETKTAGNRWTTSCVLADFNNDGWPDLYAVNYVEGEHLFDRPCRLPDGASRICTPHDFAASQDQLFLNLGDGTFREVTHESGIEVPDGKGLGIVVADFEGTGWLNLFVANDAVPNFYFSNETQRPGEQPRFSERGFVSGLAVDQEGHAEACMGVACGDANGDGRLDLFVTNFHHESNTLYLQRSAGQFEDATRWAGLAEPSLAMLGFGTQFLDLDLDGNLDLVMTNGHVGDLSHHGIPYRMRSQCFRNQGSGRFEERLAVNAGPFFSVERLGRGLARLDANRDGQEDFVVSHLDDPAALVLNQSTDTGHPVAIRLIGTRLDRDAIGAQVRIRVGTRNWTQQLTAGDGYQASNERRLVFGLGANRKVDELQVRWRSGRVDEFRDLSASTDWIVIEGGASIVPVH